MKINSFFVLVLLMAAGCGFKETMDGGQDEVSEPARLGDSLMKVDLVVPEQDVLDEADIRLSVEPYSELRNVVMKIDGQDVGHISSLPFEKKINRQTYPAKAEILIEVEAEDKSLQKQVIVKKVIFYKEDDNLREDRVDPGCESRTTFDACLFLKNPVAQNRGPIPSGIVYGRDLQKTQTYGIKLKGLDDPERLGNRHFNIVTSSGRLAKPTAGSWKQRYQDDGDNHQVAQLMSYYWLNRGLEQFRFKTGLAYAQDAQIRVDAFNSMVQNNAYWSSATNELVMGQFSSQEAALSAEILVHEYGHANLDYATGKTLVVSSQVCASRNGCLGAIHEGQADFHAFMLFPTDPTMAQSITNTMAGWAARDPRKFSGWNLDQFYSWSRGEIHGMGSAYASLLWAIYRDTRMRSVDFEKIFALHLARLRSESDFVEAKDILIQIAEAYFPGTEYGKLILEKFQAMGVP